MSTTHGLLTGSNSSGVAAEGPSHLMTARTPTLRRGRSQPPPTGGMNLSMSYEFTSPSQLRSLTQYRLHVCSAIHVAGSPMAWMKWSMSYASGP